MNYQFKTHCPNCFRESQQATCQHCQFNRDDYLKHDAANHHLPLFTKLNKGYVVGRVLGEGGFAVVYAALREADNLSFAIKEYYPEALASRGLDGCTVQPKRKESDRLTIWQRRFEQEGELLRRCQDYPPITGVVRFADLIKQHNTAYLAMERLHGNSLRLYLNEAKTAQWIISWLNPLLDTLAQLHGRAIFHRDISPNNVFLTADNKPVLMDFGLAREGIRDSALKSSTVGAGTEGFIAPEQTMEATSNRVDARTDLYSLGGLIYMALLGEPPPSATHRTQGAQLKRCKNASGLTEQLEKLAFHCLALDRNKRPENVAIIQKQYVLPQQPSISAKTIIPNKSQAEIKLAKKYQTDVEFKEGDLQLSFRLAIRNIVNFGDTDIFPFPYETRMFDDMEDEIIDSLIETHNNFDKRLTESPPLNINCCTTLGYTGHRWATQIDPYWNAYFLGLVISLAHKIEETRLSSKNVYSYRFKPNSGKGSLFSEQINWRNFQEDSLAYCNENKAINYVLICDIADFYLSISHHRLENTLNRIDYKKEISLKIKRLAQEFSSKTSYGLPVGCPASRILAELALNSIDHILYSNKVAFKRYVDDFIIFCESKEVAYSLLTLLTRKLMENEGLSLQKHKTNIISKEEFVAITQVKLHGMDEEEGSPIKAKFMKLRIKYDPYSENADEQYDKIKDSLKDFDLLEMLNSEVQKSKINQPFTKQIIRTFSATNNSVLSSSYKIICTNINNLYPIFTTIIQVATSNWDRFDLEAKFNIKNTIKHLIESDSFILKIDLNVAYIVRLIAKENSLDNQILLIDLYKKNSDSILVVNIITQAMAKWRAHYWLSDLKGIFQTISSAQKRLFIISSYLLSDEGESWRADNKNNFNFIEKLYNNWGEYRCQTNNLKDAL